MENSKKKIVIAALAIVLIGSGVYFTTGGSFLQGRLSRELAPESGQLGALENPDLAQRANQLEPLGELLTPRNNDLMTRGSENETQAEQPRVTPETPPQTPLEEPPETPPQTPPEEHDTTEPDESAPVPPEETPAPAPDEPVAPPDETPVPATENATPADPTPDEPVAPPDETPAAATENATPASENLPTTPLPAIFDTTNFAVTAILDPQKGGTFSLINASTGIRYGQNGTKDSYRISIDFPTYQGAETSYSYDVPLSAVICKESTCASAHSETVTIYKEPFTSDQKYTYLTVTRGELYNAVQTLGVSHGTKVDFKMQIQDPNGETHTSTSPFNQKIEDDALRIAFDLENFKLTKGTYVPATDGPFIQLDYTQTDGKTNEGIKYFYKGDENSFKFFIEVCDAANAEICGNYLEIESTDVATIGGSWPIPISNLKTFTDGVGFTSGTKLLFKLAVQDNVADAIKYYAKGFYLYLLP